MNRFLPALAAACALLAPATAHAACANPIACENALPGTARSTWDISGAGNATLQGFATQISVGAGETVRMKIKTPARAYRLDIYRMGYYGGAGARKVATVSPSATLPQSQPACANQTSTGLIDCGNWAVSASWTVPADAVSGIYFAKVVRTDGTSGSSHVVFVVRNDARASDLLFQTSDTTWQAYNSYGGNSLYGGAPDDRAWKVSYNRPFNTRAENPEDWVFNAEYPAVRWLEANGYDVSYLAGADVDRDGALLRSHRVVLSVGHDEYWSGGQRANVEAARAAGVNLAFLSGNEVFWKTRWEDGHRTLVCYKETQDDLILDPLDPPTWTGTWRDPRYSPPADGGRPENALTGTLFMVNGPRDDAIKVPAAFAPLRFWRNTSVATLAPGATRVMPTGTLGYEWDADVDNGSRPPGLVRLSRATYDVSPNLLLDYGTTFGNGSATHSATLYRAPSGALVFGAGSVQWSWGLDGSTADRDMQQATLNVLADMGAQPATRQAGLVAATASTDTTAPAAAITSAPASATQGTPVSVSGTAADSGGGVVGAVEVSADDGQTWHPASGTTTWTYTWVPSAPGTATLRARAADDSANLGAPSPGVAVTVAGRSCPCSLWSDADRPANPNESDAAAVELGVKFRADRAGRITGLRFYKSAKNTGTHVGRLWSRGGALLASATFTGETASGWQRVI